ncbi:MAG TPA: HDOD domain-containing protein [Terriglobales bacterium]|jgi:putative nucleotidyltransferase with HDIG domain
MHNAVRIKLESMHKMPSIPALLYPLLKYLERPLEKVEMREIVDLISRDESLAAQCLQFANSPLFGRWQRIDTVRAAVLSLGVRRMQDIALSCCILKITPSDRSVLDPITFWEHSLGCALLCRHFARSIGFVNPDRAYLVGLLHDIGLLVNLWVVPKEFANAVQTARTQKIALYDAEMDTMGLSHCETGALLAERWRFALEICEVIRHHHDAERAHSQKGLVALVSLTDLLCRMRALGYGYAEEREVDFTRQEAFFILLEECPALKKFDWARFTLELEPYMEEVKRLVASIFRVS